MLHAAVQLPLGLFHLIYLIPLDTVVSVVIALFYHSLFTFSDHSVTDALEVSFKKTNIFSTVECLHIHEVPKQGSFNFQKHF